MVFISCCLRSGREKWCRGEVRTAATGRRLASAGRSLPNKLHGSRRQGPAATDVDVEVGATEILSYASSPLNESNRLVHSLVKVKVNELGGRAETVSVNVD